MKKSTAAAAESRIKKPIVKSETRVVIQRQILSFMPVVYHTLRETQAFFCFFIRFFVSRLVSMTYGGGAARPA